MSEELVLVTGGSGFIAQHCILALLEAGYRVRTTLRSLSREAEVLSNLRTGGAEPGDRLSFAAADLTADDGWLEAAADCAYIIHGASPTPSGDQVREEDWIRPAVDGNLRVLRAARDAGIRRVVLTSAFHAVSWGHPHGDHVFTEKDWTVPDGPGVDAYGKSKTLAERAAWDFVSSHGGAPELTTMLPVAVMGPVMGREVTGANHVVQRLLTGTLRAFPDLYIPIVDVRDVAAAHILAMTHPDAAGERFLLSNGPAIAMKDIGAIIKAELGEAARRVPTRSMPSVVVRIVARFRKELRPFVRDLGYAKQTSNEKARRMLGWNPKTPRVAIVDAAKSMLRSGLLG